MGTFADLKTLCDSLCFLFLLGCMHTDKDAQQREKDSVVAQVVHTEIRKLET